MDVWMVLVLGGMLTYMTRLSFIVLSGILETPPLFRQALKFVPPAVLSALIFPELLLSNGTIDFSLSNLRLFAGMAAMFVALRTRNIWLTIFSGMMILVILEAFL